MKREAEQSRFILVPQLLVAAKNESLQKEFKLSKWEF